MGIGDVFKSVKGSFTSAIADALDLQKKESGGWGLTPDYFSFRNTYFGQQQPVSYALLWKAYLEDPVIFACINLTKEAIIGDGYRLSGGAPRNRKKFKKICDQEAFTNKLGDIVTMLLIYGDAYMELVREKETGVVREFYPRDARTIRIDYNEHGEPIKYIQRVLHRRVDFYPDEMIHFMLNVIGNRQYGHSSLQSVLGNLQAKLSAENYNADFFRRGAIPRIHYNVKNLSEEQLKRFRSSLANVQYNQDVVTVGEVEAKPLASTYQDMQFNDLLKYYRQNIIAALGVPPVFLGITEGSNRSNAQVQLEAWDRKIRALKIAIADKINNQFITAENFGFEDVIFEFLDENNREELKDAQTVSLLVPLVQQGILTPNELRSKLKLPPKEELEGPQGYDGSPNQGSPGQGGWLTNPQERYDPRQNQERQEGRERQNVEQQMENKDYGFSDEDLMDDIKKKDRYPVTVPKDYPKGIRQTDELVVHPRGSRQDKPTLERNPSRERMHQGSITMHRTLETATGQKVGSPITTNTTPPKAIGNIGQTTYGGRRNPFGAVSVVQDPQAMREQAERLRSDKDTDIREIAFNPISNAEDTNQQRLWPRDKYIPIKTEKNLKLLGNRLMRSLK